MPLNFNGTNIEQVIYNKVNLEKIICNGVTVFEKTRYIWKPYQYGVFEGVRTNGFGLVNDDKWQAPGNVKSEGAELVLQGGLSVYASVFSKQMIDITKYKTCIITVGYVNSHSYGGSVRMGFTNTRNNNYDGRYRDVTSNTTININISDLSGFYYFAFAFVGETEIQIKEIKLIY